MTSPWASCTARPARPVSSAASATRCASPAATTAARSSTTRSVSPVVLFDIKLGVLGRWHKDKITVELQPALFIGLTSRSVDQPQPGGGTITIHENRDILSIPVTGF